MLEPLKSMSPGTTVFTDPSLYGGNAEWRIQGGMDQGVGTLPLEMSA